MFDHEDVKTTKKIRSFSVLFYISNLKKRSSKNMRLTPKCLSLGKCVFLMKKEHWLLVIPNEAKKFFFKIQPHRCFKSLLISVLINFECKIAKGVVRL